MKIALKRHLYRVITHFIKCKSTVLRTSSGVRFGGRFAVPSLGAGKMAIAIAHGSVSYTGAVGPVPCGGTSQVR